MARKKTPEAPKDASATPSGSSLDIDYVPNNDVSRIGVNVFALSIFCAAAVLVLVTFHLSLSPLSISCSIIIGLFASATVRIAPQWEREIILRFGRFSRVAGPGLYLTIPLIESAASHVDQRIIASVFSAEQALTADLAPVDVDAVLFWMVWDPQAASLNVANYPKAVLWSAQTALRDAIGQSDLESFVRRRKLVDREIQEALGKKCEDWGISVVSVEIRNISVPSELQDALSKEVQATKERDARNIIAEAEQEIASNYITAASVYGMPDKALQLRAMNLARECAKDSRGFVLMPSALSDAFDLDLPLK